MAEDFREFAAVGRAEIGIVEGAGDGVFSSLVQKLVESRERIIEHRTPNIEHRRGRNWDSVFAGEPEDFHAWNGVEVWVAMDEDDAFRIRDSGDESIGQGQTIWCGISQTDHCKAGFRVHGQESGQADGVLQEGIFPLFQLWHQLA